MPPRKTSRKNTPAEPEVLGAGTNFLRSVTRRGTGNDDRFPFNVPVIRTMETLSFPGAVTFFVGENGSGKSTMLEGIASAARLPAVGSADLAADASLSSQRELGSALRLTWGRRTHRGFFLRAEDFFGFAKRISAMRAEFQQKLAELEVEYADRSAWARGQAMLPASNSIRALEQRYGVDLDANSHGQSFLKLFRSRFVPGGLYLLDEPEAPLSPQSQLALILMIRDMVKQDAQFIVATHSPILLAYPGASVVSFDRIPAAVVPYDELEHVTLTRDFLNAPERYIRALEEET
jgi:predicted ATPase